MYKFKQLNWFQQCEADGVFAEPHGLAWRYSISDIKNGHFQFAILDADYDYLPGFPESCTSFAEAKEKAMKHYLSFLVELVEW